MADTSKTFGDFYDKVVNTSIVEAKVWLREWRALADKPTWLRAKKQPLTAKLVTLFAEDMVATIQTGIAKSSCIDARFDRTVKAGHAFLNELRDVATRFGVDVSEIVDTPLMTHEAAVRLRRTKSP